MTDDIIEAAARALREMDIHKSITADYGYDFTAEAVLAAVTPLIRAAALEEAATEAEDCVTGEDAAYNIRSLKKQPAESSAP